MDTFHELRLARISDDGPDPESFGELLLENGAAGIWIEDACIHAFVAGSPDTLIALASSAGYECSSADAVQEKDWTRLCPELHEPVTAGIFRIVPVMEHRAQPPPPDEIRILLGTAFGTGHHATTALTTALLCGLRNDGLKPASVLDLGTGTAVLAIAAARLFQVPVLAIDNDRLTEANALENIAANAVTDLVTWKLADAQLENSPCDLLIANLYTDLQLTLAAQYPKWLNAGGRLVLSGIETARKAEVLDQLGKSGFHCLQAADRDGWCALVFTASGDNQS